MGDGAKQPVHSFLGAKGLGIQQGVALNTPIERGSDVGFGGVQFSGPPYFGPLDFFLLNLGPMDPNDSRKPPMRANKTPLN